MSAAELARFQHPACKNCTAFVPDCMVPISDDETVALCWYCAHMVTAHDHVVGEVIDTRVCECEESEILPPDVAELRELRRERDEAVSTGELPANDRTQKAPMYVHAPDHVGRHSKRWAALGTRIVAGRPFALQHHDPSPAEMIANGVDPMRESSLSAAVRADNIERAIRAREMGVELPVEQHCRIVSDEEKAERKRGYKGTIHPTNTGRWVGEFPEADPEVTK